MTLVDEIGPDPGGDDMLAAEYVLGVLPQEERRLAATRIENEPDFARRVDRWEAHFGSLAGDYAPVEPPGAIKTALDRRLFDASDALSSPSAPARQGLWSSLAFWRGLAAAALAAFVLYVAVPTMGPPAVAPAPRLAASLSAEGSDVRYLALYDATRGEVSLSLLSGQRPPERDFELWMIRGSNPPVSMGLVPVGAQARVPLDAATGAQLGAGTVLAVSVEPLGGSPTGQPTGPVVAAGALRAI